MPKKCCVIGCRSGYDANKEKVNTFKFPNDEKLKMEWLIAIGRKDYKPSQWASVCHKHFHEDDIIRHCVGVDPETGNEALFPVRVKLQEGAIPRINLNNSKSYAETEIKQRGRRPGRPRKVQKLITTQSSSDEDIPLEVLKSQNSSANTSAFDNADSNTVGKDSGKTLKQRFFNLLDQYEQLKDRHVALEQEIDVLEKANIDLKCKLFKF